MILAKTPA